MAEDFTATWCVYCPVAGRALHSLITTYPLTFTYFQIHGNSDTYQIPFGVTRQSYYGVTGYPTVWFDGGASAVGSYSSDAQQIAWYTQIYNARRAIATDVTVDVGGVPAGGNTYTITVRVSLDPNGTAKTVRLYTVHALDHFPSSTDNHYRNCLRLPTPPAYVDVALTAGQVVDALTWNCTFDGTSWAQQANIRIIAWAQHPASNGSGGAGSLYNAKMMSWPFAPLPPLYTMGDVNCDGVVNFDDINPFVLAVSDPVAYHAAYPNCNINSADCNQDGVVNFDDINPFVALLGG